MNRLVANVCHDRGSLVPWPRFFSIAMSSRAGAVLFSSLEIPIYTLVGELKVRKQQLPHRC